MRKKKEDQLYHNNITLWTTCSWGGESVCTWTINIPWIEYTMIYKKDVELQTVTALVLMFGRVQWGSITLLTSYLMLNA